MARIKALDYAEVGPEVRPEYDRQIQVNGRMTNMKRTLAHSYPALRALLEWYPLHDAVQPFLGERLTDLFTHAISAQTDCLICSTYFRRVLIEKGEDPDNLVLDPRESLLVEFGRQLAVDSNAVSDELFARLEEYFTPKQIVELTAFGAIMLATNVFNNALKVDLDDYLTPYRKTGAEKTTV
jgi:alkylhydroperoxidase family enzyme